MFWIFVRMRREYEYKIFEFGCLMVDIDSCVLIIKS